MSGEIISGGIFTGEILSGEILTGSTPNMTGMLGSPMVFRNWIRGLVKSIGSWCLGYWYVPVFIIAVYVFLLVGYNLLWGYLLSKLQKKNEGGKNDGENS